MTQNPILDAPAVREARGNIEGRLDGKHTRKWWEDAQRDLDAYAAAILGEVKRRVEGMETEGPDESPEGRPVMVPAPFGNYLNRAAVLALLDGGGRMTPATGDGGGKEFTRRMMAVELANEVAEFLGLNPCDEIPFRELTERLHDWRVRRRPTAEPGEGEDA